MLTSNSLHTESWLHLSHAIQPLNDGPGLQTKKKGGKEKKKKKTKFKKKKEIHTRFPVALAPATAAPRRARTEGTCLTTAFHHMTKLLKVGRGVTPRSTPLRR